MNYKICLDTDVEDCKIVKNSPEWEEDLNSMDRLRERVQHEFENARSEINRQRPQVALQLLKTVLADVESLNDGRSSAEHKLLTAEALAAQRDEAAGTFFGEAVEILENMPTSPPSLRLRAAEHYADFLSAGRRASIGRRYYESARKIAVGSGLKEDSARIQLKLTLLDLELDQDPQLKNYQTMKRVADKGGYTHTEQLAVWLQHTGSLENMGQGMKYARNQNTAEEAYFTDLFRRIRQTIKHAV